MVRCSDDSLYTGWTTNVKARVQAHNAGRGSVYCKHRRPVSLVYREELPSRSEAQRRELAIKRMPRRKKLDLIAYQQHTNPSGESKDA